MRLCCHEEKSQRKRAKTTATTSNHRNCITYSSTTITRQNQYYLSRQYRQHRLILLELSFLLLGSLVLVNTITSIAAVSATSTTLSAEMPYFSRGWKPKSNTLTAFTSRQYRIKSCKRQVHSSSVSLFGGSSATSFNFDNSVPSLQPCHRSLVNNISCRSTTTNAASFSSSSYTGGGSDDNNSKIKIHSLVDNNIDNDVTLDDEDDFTMDHEDEDEDESDLVEESDSEEDEFEFTTMTFQESFSGINTDTSEEGNSEGFGSSSSTGKRGMHTSASARKEMESTMSVNRGWMDVDWDNISIQKETGATSPTKPSSVLENKIDNNELARVDELHPVATPDHPSPVEMAVVRDRIVYIKRDDLLHLRRSNASGNKARKFLPLNEMNAEDEFPDVVVSYGGPQSNAMVAIAAIVHSKNEELKNLNMKKHKNEGEEDENLLDVNQVGLDILDPEHEDDDMEEEDELTTDEAAAILELTSETGPQQSQKYFSSSSYEPPPQSYYKKKRFIYYAKKIPRYLRKQPNGNLLRAMSLGMEIVELSNARYSELFGGEYGGSPIAPKEIRAPVPGKSLWIPQGGACGVAVPGARFLAKEIVTFWAKRSCDVPLSVCVPGGTSTTAMLLHKEMNILLNQRESEGKQKLDIQVVAIPCVGDDTYALRQMMALDANTGGTGEPGNTPTILRPHPDGNYGSSRRRLGGYFVFGEPAAAILQTFQEMKEEHGVFLDLLYGAPAWSLLLQHWRATPSTGVGKALRGKRYIDDSCPIAGRQVMYVHSGGQEGISSQLTRYKHKGLIDSSELQ